MSISKYLLKAIFILNILMVPAFCYPQAYSGFSQHSINCTVLLEKKIGDEFYPHGTGFILYNYKNPAKPIVITCEHVVRNSMVYITIPADNNFLKILKANSTNRVGFGKSIWNVDGQNLRLGVILKKNSTFVTHESLDIAAFPIEFFSYDRAEDGSEKLRYTSKAAITTSIILKRSEMKVGTETFFVGFPFSIGTNHGYNLGGTYSSKVANPLIRLGSIAWISNDSPEFLLDAFSYGGNSGSPVFTKSTLFEDNYLIGMTIGHLGDSLIDQNGNKLIDGNFGLARCIWIDEILKVYEKAILLE